MQLFTAQCHVKLSQDFRVMLNTTGLCRQQNTGLITIPVWRHEADEERQSK